MKANGAAKAQIGTLIVATSGIQIANGFFGTFFALRVALAEFDTTVAGLVLSSYFAGFTVGAVFCGRIIEQFGHIRIYAAFAGIVIAATATMTLTTEPLSWMVLRALIGFGCAGLFVTTESWLSAKATSSERGRVFSIYMVGTFAALAFGQLMIGWVEIETVAPFNIIIALFAAALVLVSMTRAEQPRIIVSDFMPYGLLSRAAPIAVIGAALSGLINGAFYALVPVWMQDHKIAQVTIGHFMLAAVLGGLAFQVPVGRLSDRLDRRTVLAALSAGLAAVAIVIVQLPHVLSVVLPAAAVFGGLMSTLYPVCVAHAHDRMPTDRVVAVSGRLILAFGVGSVLGPLIGMSLLRRFDINGVFYMMAAAACLLTILAAGRMLISQSPPHLARTFRILAPQPTPLAHDPGDAAHPQRAPEAG
jgi:MFS family permease